MSATPTSDDPNLQTSPPAFVHTPASLYYAITHVFLPVRPPEISDYTPQHDHSLARAACAAADVYGTHICGTSEQAQWNCIARMLHNLQDFVQSGHLDNDHVSSQLRGMQTGDILAFFIRPQNVAIVFTRRDNSTLCEAFQVSPNSDAVEATPEPLICSYPGSAVEMSNKVFDDGEFQFELAKFLSSPDTVISDSPVPPPERRQYINTLLNGILRNIGRADDALFTSSLRSVDCTADVYRIIKHVRDHIGRPREIDGEVKQVWRRSPLWLLIRVALQTAIDRSLGRACYKQFMLFFVCTLARDKSNTTLSSDLLHLMSSKVLRRLSKLGTSPPDWLSGMALKTCTCLREMLDARWEQLNARRSPFRNPSQDELIRDTQLSLLHSGEYIQDVLANPGHKAASTPLFSNQLRCGTIEDFLSSNRTIFQEAYDINPSVTVYDVERLVTQGIDDWFAGVTNVDEACEQLEIFMDEYMFKAHNSWHGNPEILSNILLTAIELYVALDKHVVGEIPILADYPPEIPIAFLERLLLRRATSLHRLSCAYQYIFARHSQSRSGWSVLSHEFTKDSFPVRYYDQSPHLQQLKARIEQAAMNKIVGRAGPQLEGASLAHTPDGYQESQDLPRRPLADCGRSPLPASPLLAKVVIFELQCPAWVRIWRSAAPRILYGFDRWIFCDDSLDGEERHLLGRFPALRPYFVERQGPPLHVQFHFAYFYPEGSQSQNNPMLRYVVQHPNPNFSELNCLSIWQPRRRYETREFLRNLRYLLTFHSDCRGLEKYVNFTSHTSNDVLAAQADCPPDLSLDEFVAFAHLRSGGSLQWFNILQGLRSRSLNLRRLEVHFLISYAALQVGPLDLDTGAWIWHQELQDSYFCNALLDEIDSLIVDVGTRSIDGMLMSTISLLLTRVLGSSPSEDVSERAIALLQSVRRKTFSWVQDLSYELAQAPTNAERIKLLLEMASTCRSTFDVDSATIRKLFHSAEDVDALLSCAFFIHALRPEYEIESYSRLLLERDSSLSPAVEEISRDVILLDVSDYGVDLAVGHIFTSYRPVTMDQPSQRVHINLLDGALRVNGQSLGELPYDIRRMFFDQGFLVIPSNLAGMDFTALPTMSQHKVHLSLRDDNLVVRAQGNQSKEVLELIPSKKLRGDLPLALVDSHIHWLNLTTKIIEIRCLYQLWEYSAENWRINCASGQYRVYRGPETLVDICSPTVAMLSECFKGFNDVDRARIYLDDDEHDEYLQNRCRNLLITTSSIESVRSASMQRLTVTLPLYGLSFFVNEREELESRDFKDMVYDENQCVGALFGLENLLVLRPKTHIAETLVPEAFLLRRVLIPNGLPEIHGDHQVRIDVNPRGWHVGPLYHTYDVDTELGCLIGNGNLMSTRYLAHLHTMTSFHRPDPLTGKTGAQAALCLLQSAGCRSIVKLKAFDAAKVWTSTQYPQINAAYKEIRKRYYWDRQAYDHEVQEEHSARRTAYYLFPANVTGPTSLEDYDPHSDVSSFNQCLPRQIALDELLRNRSAPELPARSTLLRDSQQTSPYGSDTTLLDELFFSLQADSSLQREYLAHLDTSAQSVRMESQRTYSVAGRNLIEALKKHYPPITADVLLRYLASASPINIPPRWKKCLISLALLLLDFQRARRLLQFALYGLEEEFAKELENEGCDGWNPEEYPDWLLIQVQGNFLIRRAQAETAMEIMSPRSGENTVMQVNMGEGKSSVIIPIAAAALADGKQLVRVVVPKALTIQMFELLVSRLGRLTNRPIYHLPFSRSPEFDDLGRVISLQVDDLHKLMSQCMAERGILLVQPDHIVSLKLMSIEEQIHAGKLTTGPLMKHPKLIYKYIKTSLLFRSVQADSYVGNMFRSLRLSPNSSKEKDTTQADLHAHGGASRWLGLQKWLHSRARDILDESDEILHARFQLVHTIGPEQHMDGYPDRWTITQQVLRLVKRHLHSLSRHAPATVEYECGPSGSFPHVRIVRDSNFGQRLISLITEDVMAGRLPNFNFEQVSPAFQNAIRGFISDEDILQIPDTVKRVEEYAKHSCQMYLWSGLLLLRGLLTSNILLFSLSERRWRVDYGLVSQDYPYSPIGPTPTMLAVPYRAKDVPAPNTQFGHPDLTIILTCLSYYYAGLTKEQLRVSFGILLDQDDPSAEYALWTNECDPVPESLQRLNEINLRSSEQWDKVTFPLFSRNQATIDFYLSQVVFRKEAKEFPWKLSGSSWDLAEKRDKLITGFSGTNDAGWLLPMSIAQRGLDHQKGTNAMVLAYLLRPENGSYMVTHEAHERWNTHVFIRLLATQQPAIRALLDVGSQILDLSNHQVARTWLDIYRDTDGAIYFNENDELMVLTRNHIIPMPMISSPLCQQLDRCVVYLDHAHTRGTDIKLPIGSRAAVTLGPKVTKDALVQGCMRMRKLGHGHSVMFFATPKVDRSIRVACKKDPTTQVTTVDVLCWAINETWTDIQQRAPYWAQQGMNHKSRYDAWSRFCSNDLTPEQLSDAWLQPEQKSLVDLYAPCEAKNTQSDLSALDPEIRQHCKNLGVLSLPSALIEEEQEREVSREQERERDVELPPKAEPAEHFLHPDVVSFVKTGIIPPLSFVRSSGFRPIFTTFDNNSAATREAEIWSPFILATADFCETIKPESTQGTMDQYLRPVQWVLSRTQDRDPLLVLLSQFEANLLMPDIRASKCVHLHLYAPRTSQRMKPSDDLRLYSILPLPSDWTPPWDLVEQLNVFAGQLYLRDYTSYLRLCRFLGVPTKDSTATRRNLFNMPGGLEEIERTFSGSPLPSVMALLAIRSRGRPFAQTHMGRILQGQLLGEQDFEGTTSESVVSDHSPTQTPHDITPATIRPPPPSDLGSHVRNLNDPGSSTLLPSPKRRRLETAERSDDSSTQDESGSLVSLRPPKRKLDSETGDITNADLEAAQKRPRTDQQ
ncbi:hypothetical protein OG21DRAFT_1484696 [Imleria badia]|nr:hypothetical protein OG21DRAFT_1484696 [Imleria badia]